MRFAIVIHEHIENLVKGREKESRGHACKDEASPYSGPLVKLPVHMLKGRYIARNVERMEDRNHLSVTDLPMHLLPRWIRRFSVVDSHRMAGESSCSDELPDRFLDTLRWSWAL
jgi:hypothetical protein